MHIRRLIISFVLQLRHVVFFAMIALLSTTPLVNAQTADGTAEAPATQPEITEPAPVDPAPVPVEPASEPPVEQPGPVIVPPAAPVVEETVEPLPATTEPAAAPSTPDIQPTATSPPTVEPSPTVAPTPVPMTISWSQPDPVRCTVLAGNAQSLALGDSATWRCDATIATTSTGDLPADLKLTWLLRADYGGDSVSFRLPEGSTDEILPPIAIPDGIEAQLQVRTPWVSADVQKLSFELVVTRTTCTVGTADLRLTATPQFETASDVEVTRTDIAPDLTPIAITTIAAENGAPTLTFDGPITFEALSATSAGLESPISHGTAVIVIDGEWNPCATWTVQLRGTVQGDSAETAQLRVVSINQELLPGGACDLGVACDVIVLPATGSAATPQRYTVGLELELSQFTSVGVMGVTVNANLASVETQP